MPREHTIDSNRVHHAWDASLKPTLHIEPGDTVHFDLSMAGHGQIRRGIPYEHTTVDFTTLYHLLGPIHVEGARPGHTLDIEILELTHGTWGWCAVLPQLGLLPEDFPDPFIRYFDLTGGDGFTELVPGVRVPINPFLGVLGTLPDTIGTASAFPPHKGGGNVDTRHVTQGATLRLPVFRDGAMFSCGDPHAAQGDGEVCVSAIETDMSATLRFNVRHQTLSTPRFTVPGRSNPPPETDGYYGTMGIHADLMQGARTAVRGMIDLLADQHGLAPEDAYVLCSIAGDLRIFEIVDADVWNVGFTLPHSLFQAPG